MIWLRHFCSKTLGQALAQHEALLQDQSGDLQLEPAIHEQCGMASWTASRAAQQTSEQPRLALKGDSVKLEGLQEEGLASLVTANA